MDDKLLRIFAAQVGLQCRAVLLADAWLRAAVSDMDSGLGDRHKGYETQVELWAAVQDLLNAAGNIAKAFWGQDRERANARADLRSW